MLDKKIIKDSLTEEQKTIKVFGQGSGCKNDCKHEKQRIVGRVPTQYVVCYQDIYELYNTVPGCITWDAWVCPWT